MKHLRNFGCRRFISILKPKLTVFLVVLGIAGLNAQKISQTQQRIILKTIQNQFGEHESLKTATQDYCNSVIICGKDTLYNPNGYFYVFKLIGDSCIRLDKSVFHGFNFGRFLFSYNKELYALGGYGGFKTNNFLLKFNFVLGEWDVMNCFGKIPKHILGVCIQRHDSIISFGNTIVGNNIKNDIIDSGIYTLDLKTKTWSDYSQKLNLKIIPKRYFEFAQYKIWIEDMRTIILNVNTLKYINIPNSEYKIRPDFIYDTASTESNLLLCTGFPKTVHSESVSLNIESIFNSSKHIKKPALVDLKEHKLNYLIYVFIIIGVLLIVLFIGVFIKKYSRNKINPTVNTDQAEDLKLILTINDLESLAPYTFNLPDLDNFFKISHLSFDSKKLKRHRILKEINSIKPGLITRERSLEDQRQFIYKINKV